MYIYNYLFLSLVPLFMQGDIVLTDDLRQFQDIAQDSPASHI